jgi:hypothetical protein
MSWKSLSIGTAVLAMIATASWFLMDMATTELRFDVAAEGNASDRALDLLVSTSEDLTGYCIAIMGYSCAVLLTQKSISKLLGAAITLTFLVSMYGAYVGLVLKLSMADVIAHGALLSGAEQPLWRGVNLQWKSMLASIGSATIVLLLVVERNLATKEAS